MVGRELPPDFIRRLEELERSYLREIDPIRGSGFGGGAERWRAEREPILDAIDHDGDVIDVGCANGYLLECLVLWGRERGVKLTPHGVDRSERLIERARSRLPRFVANLHVGDAWVWQPPRDYAYVYALHDCVPADYLAEYVARLMRSYVASGGRLILGAYGSRSRGQRALDVGAFLRDHGYAPVGQSSGGSPTVSRFAWIDRDL
jgi:SAM-dependent methyltransferase